MLTIFYDPYSSKWHVEYTECYFNQKRRIMAITDSHKDALEHVKSLVMIFGPEEFGNIDAN